MFKGKYGETIDKDMRLKIDAGLSEAVKLGMVTELTAGAQTTADKEMNQRISTIWG